jgi:hypothetical protein
MGMLDWIRQRHFDELGLARRIATESRTAVWQEIAPRAGLLTSFSEAQAYIRTRAKSAVRNGLARVLPQGRRPTVQRERQVLVLALDLLAAQFTSRMLGRRV